MTGIDAIPARAPEHRYFGKSRAVACELFRWESTLDCFTPGSRAYKAAIECLGLDAVFPAEKIIRYVSWLHRNDPVL